MMITIDCIYFELRLTLKGTLLVYLIITLLTLLTQTNKPIDFICAKNHSASMSTGGEESGAPRDPRHGGQGGRGCRGSSRGSGRAAVKAGVHQSNCIIAI